MKDGSNFSFGCLKYVFIAGFLFFGFVVLATSRGPSDPTSIGQSQRPSEQAPGASDSSLAPAPNEGFTEPPQKDSRKLSVGECYSDGVSPQAVFSQSCAESHDGEVVGIAAFDEEDFPAGGISEQWAASACGAYFSDSVKRQLSDESLMFNSSRPSEAGWEAGDRSIICMVERGFHEAPLVGRLS
ncbi:septum formation family protein [Nonomuraea sp. NPDC049158]|uniref:septum formation family protein n=1 Tax=Nonomuraea sp. NPDC049158 TaxID=3155649 RepID=UPI0033D856D8